MLLWIESQPTSVIALIVFSAAYLTAALIFSLAALLSAPNRKGSTACHAWPLVAAWNHTRHLDRLPGCAGMVELGSRAGAYWSRSHRFAGGGDARKFLAAGRQGAGAGSDRKTP